MSNKIDKMIRKAIKGKVAAYEARMSIRSDFGARAMLLPWVVKATWKFRWATLRSSLRCWWSGHQFELKKYDTMDECHCKRCLMTVFVIDYQDQLPEAQ